MAKASRNSPRAARPAVGEVVKGTDELRVPIVEERLDVQKRPTAAGEVLVHARVEETEERIPVSLAREEVEVQRVALNRVLDAAQPPPATRTEGEWLIVPVIEDELVVQKRVVLREVVRIRTRRTIEQREVRDTVRRRRVEIDDSGVPASRRPATAAAPRPASKLRVGRTGQGPK